MRDYNQHLDGDEDGLGAARGCLWALLLSAVLWGAAIGVCCLWFSSPDADSEPPRPVESSEVA